MSQPPHVDHAGDDEWVVLSPGEVPSAPDTRRPSHPTKVDYLNFQLRTVLGTFSFNLRPSGQAIDGTNSGERPIHQQEQSPLFRLPAELRLEIYEHVLRLPIPAAATNVIPRAAKGGLSILLTCRRALAEAEEVFYSVNRCSHENPVDFLQTLSPRRRLAITKFTMPVVSAAAMHVRLQQLHALPNLTSLYIQRRTSIRYLDVSGWAIMAAQIVAEIRKMEKLAEVRFLTPEATSTLTETEVARKEKLDGIDRKICSAAPQWSS
ncbi:hypothetical protein PRZ48_013192 [Zasmidium cellare]|uniref:F-box domain-containing protein n=1 Tax=Zasmidium cellare TaxID=395010 RepID=A0ABR0E3C6_ZASCE|nr:hypothetical protein PRZ48_013192 [Zasmidium cellare]